MNRQEFMNRLEYLLRGIPASEREDALAYYNDYFDEAGAENEAQVIQELGSPDAVAEKILVDVQQDGARQERGEYSSPEPDAYEKRGWEQEAATPHMSNEKKKMDKSTKILLIIILILTFPIWIGVVAGLLGAVVGVIGALFGVVVGFIGAAFGLVVGGVACMIGGILCLVPAPVDGLVSIGVGAILAAIGLLLAVPCVWGVGVWLPNGVKALVNWIKGVFHHNKGGNEI